MSGLKQRLLEEGQGNAAQNRSASKDLMRNNSSDGKSAYITEFPPMLQRPGPKSLSLLIVTGTLFVCCLTVWREWLEMRGLSSESLIKYVSIPVVSTVFTYCHIWVALYMTFYPILYMGCLQIPGTNCGCGWQGIVPSKGEKMARTSVELMTTKLLSVKDVFARIDPALFAEELEPILQRTLGDIIEEVAREEEPALWHALPSYVKEELVLKATQDSPTVIRDMMSEVKENIEAVFDLKAMVVDSLTRDPGLLNHMFIECGYMELKFIRDCGAWMGLIFGVFQVALWIYWSAGWMLPTFGLVVGLFSNWVALKMIFEPVEPIKLFGGRVVLQGLFLKRQHEVAAAYGQIVAANVLTARYLTRAIIRGPCSNKLFELVHRHVHTACDNFTGVCRPIVALVAGRDKYDKCKHKVGDNLIKKLEPTMSFVEGHLDKAMDLENILTVKMQALPSKDFEGLLHPVFQEDEWKLVLMGGVLGVIVGCAQWWALGS